MPRYGSKTYGNNTRSVVKPQETRASRAFDNILNDKPSTAKTATASGRWGQTSFTSTRSSSPALNKPVIESRKRKAERPPSSSFDDPFSFDSDDDGLDNKKKKDRQNGRSKSDSISNNNTDNNPYDDIDESDEQLKIEQPK